MLNVKAFIFFYFYLRLYSDTIFYVDDQLLNLFFVIQLILESLGCRWVVLGCHRAGPVSF